MGLIAVLMVSGLLFAAMKGKSNDLGGTEEPIDALSNIDQEYDEFLKEEQHKAVTQDDESKNEPQNELSEEDRAFYEKRGELTRKRAEADANGDILYAKGKTVEIYQSEMEIAIHYSLYVGETQEEAERIALEHFTVQKSLYNTAVQKGYSASDEEAEEIIEILKDVLEEEGGNCNIAVEIKGYGSEEEYWDTLRRASYKNVLIDKYVNDLSKKWGEEQGMNTKSQEFRDAWWDEFEKVKERLVEEENVIII